VGGQFQCIKKQHASTSVLDEDLARKRYMQLAALES